MISEQTALNTLTPEPLVGTRRATFCCQQVAGMGASCIRASLAGLMRAFTAWASSPSLPHAALWEASVIVSLVTTEHASHTPDPFERSALTGGTAVACPAAGPRVAVAAQQTDSCRAE
jgi:hypothetical protein